MKTLIDTTSKIDRRLFLKGAASLAAAGGFVPRLAAEPYPPYLNSSKGASPRLVVGIISDTHVGVPAHTAVLERTFRFFRDRKVDAVMNCGDIADFGLLSGLKYYAETFEKVFPGGKGAEGRPVQKLFCTGNHDYEGWWYGDMTAEMHALGYDEDEALVKLGMKKCWEEVFQEEFAPIRKRTVNGYDFIGAEWHGYDETPGYDLTEDWFAAHGGELDTEKPFFFYLHQPPANTTASSWESALALKVTKALSAHQNAVAFSGHSHWTLNDERSIWQGEYTAIAVPSLSCTGIMDGYENGADVRNGKSTRAMPALPVRFKMEEPQGLVMSVYDNRMEFERWDFKKMVCTARTWSVPLPLVRESRPYSFEARSAAEPVPQFPEGAKLNLKTRNTETRGGKWAIVMVANFPNANAVEAARAFDYEIRAVPADGSEPMVKRFLSPAFHKLKEDEPEKLTFWFNVLDLPQDKEYRIEIYPRNCFGVCGRPLVSAPRRGKPGGVRAKGYPKPKNEESKL